MYLSITLQMARQKKQVEDPWEGSLQETVGRSGVKCCSCCGQYAIRHSHLQHDFQWHGDTGLLCLEQDPSDSMGLTSVYRTKSYMQVTELQQQAHTDTEIDICRTHFIWNSRIIVPDKNKKKISRG